MAHDYPSFPDMEGKLIPEDSPTFRRNHAMWLRAHSVSPPTSPCLEWRRNVIRSRQRREEEIMRGIDRTDTSRPRGPFSAFARLRDSLENLTLRSTPPGVLTRAGAEQLRQRSRTPPETVTSERAEQLLRRPPTPPINESFARIRDSINNLRPRSPPPELLTPPDELPALGQSMENLRVCSPPPGLITPEEENDDEWQMELIRRDELTARSSPPLTINDNDDNDDDDDDDDDDDKSKCNDGVRCVCDCSCSCVECGYRKCECDTCMITCICQSCRRERGYNSDDRDYIDNDSDDDDSENKKCKCMCYCACPLCTGMTPCIIPQNAILWE